MLRIAAGAICGIAAGAITGIAARVAMRMVADGVPDAIRSLPMFTAEGTATIVGLGALAGAPFGALFALAYDALAGPHRARGILFGVAMLLTLAPLFFTGARDEFITYERMVLFAALDIDRLRGDICRCDSKVGQDHIVGPSRPYVR